MAFIQPKRLGHWVREQSPTQRLVVDRDTSRHDQRCEDGATVERRGVGRPCDTNVRRRRNLSTNLRLFE